MIKYRLDKFKSSIHKAYKESKQYKLDSLMDLERKWARKETIAHNKLEKIRKNINKFALDNVKENIKC